jgi:chorismate mutase / prephenate dehydratase
MASKPGNSVTKSTEKKSAEKKTAGKKSPKRGTGAERAAGDLPASKVMGRQSAKAAAISLAKADPANGTAADATSGSRTGATAPGSSADHQTRPAIDLAAVRERINEMDRRLVHLLNERASLVVEVGKLKRASGLPVYVPHRDVEVIERALRNNDATPGGPVMPARAIEAIYRELMSGSFTLQQPMRIGYLGPAGSYSHEAAIKHFGSSVEFSDMQTIAGVFTEASRGHVNYGLVPIENSIHGGVTEALDAFRHLKPGAGSVELSICAEVQLEIRHCLLANTAPDAIKRIHTKPEVFSQCRHWLATQYPKADLIPAASSSRAAATVQEENRLAESQGRVPNSAAIGSELAGQIYGLNVLMQNVQDESNNITRFLVISKQKAERTGDDKTSIMFTAADKPGALVSVLSVFDRLGINLTHIDKRPSGRVNWTYTFFIDAQGHRDDAKMGEAVVEAKTHCRDLQVLGSYPRAKRIL